MAGSSLRHIDNRELSKQIWEEIYNTTQNERRRKFALQNLKELNTIDFEDKLTQLAIKYENSFGYFPSSLNELLEADYLKKLPFDHENQEFIIIPRIKSVKSRTLLEKSLKENIRLVNAKAARFRNFYGNYPDSLEVLRDFIKNETTFIFPENPFGEEYEYDPETGKISYKTDLLD